MSILQKIYYGAPGTGKSHEISNIKEIKIAPKEQVFRTTFHPEYTYFDFIGQLLPTVDKDIITYKFQRGIFTNALRQAYKDTSKPVYLIVEEMSRGNVAAIFGDIFQLLDRDDQNRSKFPIRHALIASEILQKDNGDDLISLPGNFNILGTVNTSDQNVFVMDTAFKRRFDWQYISTKPVENYSKDNVNIKIFRGENANYIKWHDFYMSLNKYITDKNNGLALSEDKQIGQFFIRFSKNMSDSTIKEIFKNKLLFYLWEDVELASYGTSNKIFSEEILNFSDLYEMFNSDQQIFSNTLLAYIGM